MAKKLSEIKDDAPKAVDVSQLKKDIESLVSRRETVMKANKEVGDEYKLLEKERGYNVGALKQLAKLYKMSPEGAADFLRTLLPGLEALGLMPDDMLDRAGRTTNTKQEAGSGIHLQ